MPDHIFNAVGFYLLAAPPASPAFLEKQSQSKFLWFGILPAFIPAALTAWAIARYPVYALYLDDWSYVHLTYLLKRGTLDFFDLWATSNDHLIFFPRLIVLAMASLTGWDPRAFFVFNYFLAAGAWLFAVLMAWRERAVLGEKNFLWIPFALAIFIFSLRQIENWVWCAEVVYYLPSLCAALCLYLLSRPVFSWKSFSGALVSAVVASASFLSGFLLWPAGLLVIFFMSADNRSQRLKALSIWNLAAAVMTVLYALNYEKPGYHPPMVYDPSLIFHYLVIYAGSMLAHQPQAAVIPGLSALISFLVLAGALFYLKSFPPRVIAAFSAPGVFAILNGIVTAVGRTGFGVDQAAQARYTTFSSYLWISILLLCVLVSRALILRLGSGGGWKSFLPRLPLLLCFAVMIQAAQISFNSLPAIAFHQERVNRAGVEILDSSDPDLSLLFGDPALLEGPIAFLKTEKMNIFDPKLAALLRQSVNQAQDISKGGRET